MRLKINEDKAATNLEKIRLVVLFTRSRGRRDILSTSMEPEKRENILMKSYQSDLSNLQS